MKLVSIIFVNLTLLLSCQSSEKTEDQFGEWVNNYKGYEKTVIKRYNKEHNIQFMAVSFYKDYIVELDYLINGIGHTIRFYEDGKIISIGRRNILHLDSNKYLSPYDSWKNYSSKGVLRTESEYKLGKIDTSTFFSPTGQVLSKTSFTDGIKDGKSLTFWPNGELAIEEIWADGELLSKRITKDSFPKYYHNHLDSLEIEIFYND